jgi:hypothetical protein
MNRAAIEEIAEDLLAHQSVCEELLNLARQQHSLLASPESSGGIELVPERQAALGKLSELLDRLRRHRHAWHSAAPSVRAAYPGVQQLLRSTQDLIMKVLVLDRENEQGLLHRGLVPPKHMPPADRQRPHFVADMYRRNSMA